MKSGALCFFVSLSAISLFAASNPVRLKYDPTDPKFLVPVSPYGRDYEEAVEKILGNRWGLGTMIYDDSVGKKFAVSVWGKDYADYDYDHPLHNFVTYLKLTSDSDDHLRAETNVDVPIDLELAMAVQRAWATMLLKSRYPEKSFSGADGWSVEFSVWIKSAGGVYGYAWSPSTGLTKELMDLGVSLADYCKATEAERPARRQKLMRGLEEFRQKAEKAE